MTAESTSSTPGPWDHVAQQLIEWRHNADEPSYTEIALRISRAREGQGVDPPAARVGRTTVYDAFRLGRARINRGLVREIGQALGVSDADIAALLEGPRAVATPPTEAAPKIAPSKVTPAEIAPVEVPPASGPPRYDVRQSVVLMLLFLGVNFLGRELVDTLQLTLYLDMMGTALAAIVLGPWRGAVVGASTNLLLYFVTGPVSVPFALVNVVGALLWGYGVHRLGLGRSLARFFALNLMVAVACTVVAVPILFFVFGGTVGHQQDSATATLLALTENLATALIGANLLTSVIDKTISSFVALVGATMLGHSVAGVAAGSPPKLLASFSAPARPGARTR